MKMPWKRALASLSFCVAIAGAFVPPTSHAAAPTTEASVAAAQSGLASLKELVTEDNYKDLGFESLDEVKKASLAGPLAVRMIQLDELLTLDPSATPESALHDLKQKIFPVFAKGKVRSAITVSQNAGGTWAVTSIGDAALIKALEGAKGVHSRATGKSHPYEVIQVPALFQVFLAFTDGSGKMHFVTVREDARLGTAKKGEARLARTVLDLLTALAKTTTTMTKKRTK